MNRTLRAAGPIIVVGALIGGCSSSSGSSAPTTAPQPSAAAPSRAEASQSENFSTYTQAKTLVYNFFGQFQSDWSLVSADTC